MKKKLFIMVLLTVNMIVYADDRYEQYYSADEQELKAARQEYDQMREELDRLVARNIDENSVHFVLRLLAVELQLVDKLLHDETGARLDDLLAKKKKLLEAGTKTAGYLYKAIIKFATNDILLTGKNGESKLGSTLRTSDKRRYLRRMKKILIDYRDDFLDKQYESFKRTLGLPSARYAPYNQQEQHGVNGDSLQVGTMSSLFRYEPQWSYDDRYGYAAQTPENLVWGQNPIMNHDQQSVDTKFTQLWDDCVARVDPNDVARLIDDVLTLVRYEIKTHVGSVEQRNKMLYGADESEQTMFFDLVQALSQVSPRARALFSTLREAATENTIKLGYWNPDVYEGYLEKYATRLESAKESATTESSTMAHVVQQDLGDCCDQIHYSMEHLTENLVYNVVPGNA